MRSPSRSSVNTWVPRLGREEAAAVSFALRANVYVAGALRRLDAESAAYARLVQHRARGSES